MNRAGVMNRSAIVPNIMSPITPIASDLEPFEPTPVANFIGTRPSIIVAEVISIWQKRALAANSADSFMSLPLHVPRWHIR